MFPDKIHMNQIIIIQTFLIIIDDISAILWSFNLDSFIP